MRYKLGIKSVKCGTQNTTKVVIISYLTPPPFPPDLALLYTAPCGITPRNPHTLPLPSQRPLHPPHTYHPPHPPNHNPPPVPITQVSEV